MSVHAMIAAAYLEDLDPSTKLVLMAVADSSDEHTLEAAPGLPKLRAWAGLGRAQTLNLVKTLTDAGYLERVAPGRAGLRAVYRVFPNGLPQIPHPSEVAARYEPPPTPVSNPVDNPQDQGPTGRTLDPSQGPMDPGLGSDSYRTPSCITSVSRLAQRSSPVDRPTTTSRPSGFPRARKSVDETSRPPTGIACPIHPLEVHPCRRCTHDRRPADEVADQLAAVRRQLKTPPPPTEEQPA